MAHVNEKKLLKKRSNKMLDFFFKVYSKSIIVTLLLLGIAIGATYLVMDKELVTLHCILGRVSVFFFVIFLLSILRLFNNKLSYDDVEAMMAIDRNVAYNGLFQNLAIKNQKSEYVAEPIEITTPEVYPGRKTIVYRYVKKRSRVYYSQTGYTWLFFGEERLFYYHASINHIYGFVGYEVASEVEYKNIVHVKTESTYSRGAECITMTLSLVNGETIKINLRTRPTNMYESSHALTELEEKVLTSIRKVIRDNK
jgi:hypothetical protein